MLFHVFLNAILKKMQSFHVFLNVTSNYFKLKHYPRTFPGIFLFCLGLK